MLHRLSRVVGLLSGKVILLLYGHLLYEFVKGLFDLAEDSWFTQWVLAFHLLDHVFHQIAS